MTLKSLCRRPDGLESLSRSTISTHFAQGQIRLTSIHSINSFTCILCHNQDKRHKARKKRLKAAGNHHGITHDSSSQTTASSSSVTTSTTADTMYSFPSASGNPFLLDDGEAGSIASRECREPDCQEKALKDLPTCHTHFVAPPGVRSLMTAVSPPSRKILDGKKTARKSTTRTPFLQAEAKPNQSLSANSRLSNGHSTNKVSYTRPPEPSVSEIPVRKRQRLISPRHEDATLMPGRSASPLAMPNGLSPGLQNGKIIDTALYRSGKLPTLNADMRSFSSATADLDGRQRPVLSYGDYLKSPLTAGLTFAGDLPKIGAGTFSAEDRSLGAVSSPKSHTNGSFEKMSDHKSPPKRITPTRTRPAQNEKVSASPHSQLKAITRTPPMEKQRRSLVQERVSNFENFIYAQSDTSQPPPGGQSIRRLELKRQKTVLYAPIDPRSHWTRPHSEAWYQRKEEEIRARGGRKANFGKATHRMKVQRSKQDSETFEAGLPDRVLENGNWVSALRWFDEQSNGGSQTVPTSSTPIKTKRPYRRRQPDPTSNSSERLAGGHPLGD